MLNRFKHSQNNSNTKSAGDYFHDEYLTKGSHSDISIEMFNKEYNLHKSVLVFNSPFFRDALSLPDYNQTINESTPDYFKEKSPDEKTDLPLYTGTRDSITYLSENYYRLTIDNPIVTQKGFELMLARIYKSPDTKSESKIPLEMLITGQYFGVTELVEDALINSKKHMNLEEIGTYLKQPADKWDPTLVETCKTYLLRNGWLHGAKEWDSVPIPIIAGIVSKSYFFVPNEYEKVMFIIQLIERRLINGKFSNSTQLLKLVLNRKIIYANILGDKLSSLQAYKDVNGEPYILPATIQNAMMEYLVMDNSTTRSKDSSPKTTGFNENESINSYSYFSTASEDMCSSSQLEYFINEDNKTHPIKKTHIPPFRSSFMFDLTDMKKYTLKTDLFYYAGSYWSVTLVKNGEDIINKRKQYQLKVMVEPEAHKLKSKPSISNAKQKMTRRFSNSGGANSMNYSNYHENKFSTRFRSNSADSFTSTRQKVSSRLPGPMNFSKSKFKNSNSKHFHTSSSDLSLDKRQEIPLPDIDVAATIYYDSLKPDEKLGGLKFSTTGVYNVSEKADGWLTLNEGEELNDHTESLKFSIVLNVV